MSSFRQIAANRRNAQLSTGPVTEEGKRRSRQNAVRHGLTAETVICSLENAEDYAAFEMSVTADFDARSAVERELVLRLASLLWRLRRASAIEAGLFNIQARELLNLRTPTSRERRGVVRAAFSSGSACAENTHQEQDQHIRYLERKSQTDLGPDGKSEAATDSFLRLTHHPTSPLDRLTRYEATLWRQACQILWTLQSLDRRKPWESHRRPSQIRF